jgi:hypothetical protein
VRDKIKAALQRLRAALAAGLRAVPGMVSLRDLLCFGGLGCVGYGLSLVSEPAAWCVVGAVLFWLSVRRLDGPA